MFFQPLAPRNLGCPDGTENDVTVICPPPCARGHSLPREKSHQRSRLAGIIAIVEVIGAWVVIIDRQLHQSQPEDAA